MNVSLRNNTSGESSFLLLGNMMTTAAPLQPPFTCQIGPDDTIVSINDAWRRFAKENGVPTLAQEVIGSPLWKYITGSSVAHLYAQLLAKARETNVESSFPFRCDSPAVRRFMRMRIIPQVDRSLEFCSWIEREVPWPQPILLLDPSSRKDPGQLLRMCSWCKKIDVEGAWLEIDEGIAQMRLFDHVRVPRITHGICESCLAMMMIESEASLGPPWQ